MIDFFIEFEKRAKKKKKKRLQGDVNKAIDFKDLISSIEIKLLTHKNAMLFLFLFIFGK